METPRVIRLPVEYPATVQTLSDIVAAIELVACGAARRVVLSGLPGARDEAAEALAYAQSAGVRFALVGPDEAGAPTVVVGPRDQ